MAFMKHETKDVEPGISGKLKRMDVWFLRGFLLVPVVLFAIGGKDLAKLTFLMWPVLSVVFLVYRYFFIKGLSVEQRRDIVEYSYIYVGNALSRVVVALCVMSLIAALFRMI